MTLLNLIKRLLGLEDKYVDADIRKHINTLNADGTFTKEAHDAFEAIWVDKNVNDFYDAGYDLTDNEYIDYYIWLDQHDKDMYAKHLPHYSVYRGDNPNIIFHGGCLGCKSQRLHGIDRCKGCSYFRGYRSKPNLHIKGEDCATLSKDDLDKLLGCD